jgi:branched-chain amino acid transport system substrate-binding protein
MDIGTVKYGFLNPMTGPYGGLAVGQRNGNKLAVQWVSESDDFDFEMEGFYEDTEADASTGQQMAQKLKQQEDVGYLQGAISSSTALGLNSFAEQNQVIYNPGGAAIPITGAECNKYVFRFETSTAQIAESAAPYTMENIGTDVWFHIADYAWGNSVRKEWGDRMDAAGDLTVVGDSKSALGAGNYSSYISQMANSDASVAMLGLNGGDLIKFLKQAEGQGLQDQIKLVSPTASFQIVRGAAGTAAEGVHSGVRYLPKLESGDNPEFAQRYQDQFDTTPDNFARVGFESVRMVAKGIQEAGTKDPTAVAETLSGMEMNTIFGQNRFRECDQQAVNPVWMGEIEAGSGEMPAVNVVEKIEGENAIPPCGSTECSL